MVMTDRGECVGLLLTVAQRSPQGNDFPEFFYCLPLRFSRPLAADYCRLCKHSLGGDADLITGRGCPKLLDLRVVTPLRRVLMPCPHLQPVTARSLGDQRNRLRAFRPVRAVYVGDLLAVRAIECDE